MKGNPTIDLLDSEITRRQDDLAALIRVRDLLREGTIVVPQQPLLLTGPKTARRKRKARKPAGVKRAGNNKTESPQKPDASSTECPLDWELSGKIFTLERSEALLMRTLSGGEVISKEALLEALGKSPAAFFTSLRKLRSILEDQVTGHTIAIIRGEGYQLAEQSSA